MTSLNILLIDDNPDDRTLALRELKQLFSQLQYWEIGDNIELNKALQANEFNLVVTDYQLCWTTGLDILHTIKQQRPDCPVVMFTGTGSEEIAVKALKAGLDDYIIKSSSHYVKLAATVRSIWERLQQQQALTELKQQYERLFERVPIGLYRLDPQGKILEINSTLVKMLGYTKREDLLSYNISNFYLNYRQEQNWQQHLEQNGAIADFEVQARCHNGKIIWMRHQATAVKNQNGEIVYYEGAVEDISERQKAERERTELLQRELKARQEAETANLLKDRFFTTLSHELRSPLNTIIGWIQLLRSGQLNSEQIQKALETIERNAKTQNQQIENLLDVARIIRGDLQLNLLPVALSSPISDAIDIVRPLANAKQLELELTLQQDLKEVNGDPKRLQQIFWNLLSNSIKFTPKGGKISVTLEYFSNRARVRIEDNGRGIAPEVLPYIFERFSRADNNSFESHKGLGLGLTTARDLVEMHSGIIVAQSAGSDKGAIFIVELPLI